MDLGHLKSKYLKILKKIFLKRNFIHMVIEYFSYGKIIKSKNIKFCEVGISMNYPTKKDYSKIRPILDWYIILKYWIKGLIDKNEL